jgi:hypothetical protein
MQPATLFPHPCATPAARPAPAATPPHPAPYLRTRPAAIASSALTMLCSGARLRQAWAVADGVNPPSDTVPTVADLLLSSCGIGQPPGSDRPRWRITGWCQHPLHRETASGLPAAITPLAARTTQDPAQAAAAAVPVGIVQPPAAQSDSGVTALGRAMPQQRQELMHREAAATGRGATIEQGSGRGQQIAPLAARTHDKRQEPMHREAAATGRGATIEQGSGHRQQVAASAARTHDKRQEPMHREAAATGRAAAIEQGSRRGQQVELPAARIHDPRQEPMHEAAATSRAAAIEQGSGRQHPVALPAARVHDPRQEPIHREAEATGRAATIEQGSERQQPVALAAARTHDPQQEPMHREAEATGRAATIEQGSGRQQPVALPAARTHDPQQELMHGEATATAPRTGPLRNGNPRGNPNNAPRCGAKNRAGCACRAPAMRGKLRCRMHGGGSTGPRTAEGLTRLRAARTTHGLYTGESGIKLRHWITFARRSRIRLAAYRYEDRMPPAVRVRLHALPPELSTPPYPALDRAPPSCAEQRALVQREIGALAPWKRAIAFARASRRAGPPSAAMAEELDDLFATLPPVPPVPPVPPPGRRTGGEEAMHRGPPRPAKGPPGASAGAPTGAGR